jgi:dolichol-phosphate mannosyltransferase
MNKIGVVIPAYNEFENIEILVKLILKEIKCQIIVVDDSTNDKTKIIVKKRGLKVLYIQRNNKLGRGSAVLLGLKKLLKKKIDIFIEMDADLSHRPSELKRNINFFLKTSSDLLIASRYLKNSKIINWPLSRTILSFFSNIVARFILKIPVTDFTNGYRIYSRRAVILIIKKCGRAGDQFIILSEIITALFMNMYKINEINTIFVNRVRGTSSVNIKLIINSIAGLFKIFFYKKNYIIK